MMKKIIVLLLFLLVLTSCNKNEESINQPDVAAPTSNETKKEPIKVESKEPTLNGLVEYLNDNGFIDGEEVKMGAELIGAKEGIKFKTSKGNIEVYEYDISSESFSLLKESGSIEMSGFIITPSAINKQFVLMCNEHQEKDKVIKSFSEYK